MEHPLMHAIVNRPDVDSLPPTEPITLPLIDDAAVRRARAVWVEVEPGLHVANTSFTFVGTVTDTGAGFATMDGAGRPRGTFVTLGAAKGALEECTPARSRPDDVAIARTSRAWRSASAHGNLAPAV
ncbi:hypothetical protein LQ938_13175 [Microbacterium sp. cx-55]|uniref:hypothetical protein n=1 Tax=Microbacterium sp. cx-55 TaxID=2875948 RepID=UPI001CBFE200|nr:hypothetical protein [Microbacterium sp. cx-55]MBZ4487782.1 hypothetical protein [Microbacterium sp. cx-55]UGB34806.1 hypothetical protein LQ938_13175 [Microbacterium sp. cx-55]